MAWQGGEQEEGGKRENKSPVMELGVAPSCGRPFAGLFVQGLHRQTRSAASASSRRYGDQPYRRGGREGGWWWWW